MHTNTVTVYYLCAEGRQPQSIIPATLPYLGKTIKGVNDGLDQLRTNIKPKRRLCEDV